MFICILTSFLINFFQDNDFKNKDVIEVVIYPDNIPSWDEAVFVEL